MSREIERPRAMLQQGDQSLNQELERRVAEHTGGPEAANSASRQAEEALRQTRDYLEKLFDHANAPIIVWDPGFRITRFNHAFEHLTGYRAEEVLGLALSTLFPEVSREESLAKIQRTLQGERWEAVEIPILRRDGDVRVALWNSANVYAEDGQTLIATMAQGQDITDRKRAEGRLEFLAEASALLASSLDYETTLASVARLVVPHIADWCTVDVLGEDGTLQLLALAHVDPEKVRWATELRRLYPMDPNAPAGAPHVIRTGQPEVYPDIPDSMLAAVAKNEEELRLLRQVGYRSIMVVPLQAHGETLGAISLVSAESGRRYSPADLDLALELARRSATAVDNARLYRQRQQAEAALRETGDYLENLFNYANAPIIVWDRSFKITRFNHAFEHLTGHTAHEVVGQELRILFPAASQEESLAEIARTLGGEQWESVEIPILRKDGEVRVALWNSANVYATEGRTLVATIAQGQDITERRQAEERLRASEERYRLLVESARDYAIYMLDPEGRIASWSAGAERIKGYRAEEILGQPFSRFCTEEDLRQGKPEQELAVAAAEGRFEDEGWRVRKDGSRFWANVVVTALRYDDARLRGFSTVTRDMTERKQAEEEIRKLNADLMRQAAELRASNAELESFAYSVSHDLRAPLRAIDGFSQALMEDYADKLDAEGKGHLHRVRAASQRMGHLIDDILALSRVSRSEMHRGPVDLSALARTVAAELRGRQPERRADFVVAPDVVAEGDERLLRVVLENLLGNAWKFTAKHPRARIEFGVAEMDGGPAYYVRDDGAGFDMAYAGKLFGPFQRLHAESEFGGTGVGLATVQRIVRRHGGRIWAEGEVERGAAFFFTL